MPTLLILSITLNIVLAALLLRAVRNYHGMAQVLEIVETELHTELFKGVQR